MAVNRGDVVTEVARKLNDSGMTTFLQAELRSEVNNALLETVIAGRTHKEDISLAQTATVQDYSIEPCFEALMVSLGGEALIKVEDGELDIAAWDSGAVGVPTSWRQQTGATIRVNPIPDTGATGVIGEINATPTAGGSGYVIGDKLTLLAGNSDGQVRVAAVSGGIVTKLELLMKDRGSRGTGYSAAAGIATTGGSGTGCTVEITALARLEITGYSGITEPTDDTDDITAIPEYLVKRVLVPRAAAGALQNHRTGPYNIDLAEKWIQQWQFWVGILTLGRKGL